MLKSMYEVVGDAQITDIKYFYDHKVDRLFAPILNIKDIEAEPSIGRKAVKYTDDDKIKLIKFVVCCFSKESPYIKTNDTLFNIKSTVCDYLEMKWDLIELISLYKIPELEESIKKFIEQENNEFIREYLVCQNIYDRNLHASSSAIDNLGNIDVKKQSMYYDAAMSFKERLFQLKQNFSQNNFMHQKMIADFQSQTKSVFIVDLIR